MDRACIGGADMQEIFSANCRASLLGTSSPTIREKYDTVITIMGRAIMLAYSSTTGNSDKKASSGFSRVAPP